MSGGVDSSVTAAILKEKGYEVIGVTMQIWPEHGQSTSNEQSCCSVEAVNDARKVADELRMKYYVLNFKEIFQKEVVDYFISEYSRGRTPNPCIMCNRKIKFEHLLRKARALEADYLATGHYVRLEKSNGKFILKKGIDPEKDQSYALYNLTQDQLKHLLFPLGQLEKDRTRDIAYKYGLPVYAKSDSQEICFVSGNNYGDFIKEKNPETVVPGPVVDKNGNEVGKHKGLPYYTVGQRRGLGLALGYPVYVKEIDFERNTLVVAPKEDIFAEGLIASDINWISGDEPDDEVETEIKIRYNSSPVPGTVKTKGKDRVEVSFEQSQAAVTPGQSAVFYAGEELLGGGIIEKAIGN